VATLVELAASIVSAHASSSKLSTEDLLKELQTVHETLKKLEGVVEGEAPSAAEEKPALSVKQAFKPNEVICMICGKGGMKTLSRHLKQAHDIKPGQYRKQFGIPSSQPLTAKRFSEARRAKAQEIGLAANLAKAREVRAAKIKAAKEKGAAPKKVKK